MEKEEQESMSCMSKMDLNTKCLVIIELSCHVLSFFLPEDILSFQQPRPTPSSPSPGSTYLCNGHAHQDNLRNSAPMNKRLRLYNRVVKTRYTCILFSIKFARLTYQRRSLEQGRERGSYSFWLLKDPKQLVRLQRGRFRAEIRCAQSNFAYITALG